MRLRPPTSLRRRSVAPRRARARLAALAGVLYACSAGDPGPATTQLAVSSADGPAAASRCMVPVGTWRVRYRATDPGTSCALLLREDVVDFGPPDGPPPQPDVRCETRREGPDPQCRFHERRRCVHTLGGARYDSVVWQSYQVVGAHRLEGRGIASGGSVVLGLCQTTFTLEAAPE